jgi:hypothetical protein
MGTVRELPRPATKPGSGRLRGCASRSRHGYGAVDAFIEQPGAGPDALTRNAGRYDLPTLGVKIYVACLEDIIQ